MSVTAQQAPRFAAKPPQPHILKLSPAIGERPFFSPVDRTDRLPPYPSRQSSAGGDKFIATSRILLQSAQALYGA